MLTLWICQFGYNVVLSARLSSALLGDVRENMVNRRMVAFCFLLLFPSAIFADITFDPFKSPVNILETVTQETFLDRVDCTATPPDFCMCNLGSSNYGDPFDVWKKGGNADFEVFYVGAASGGTLSYKRKPTYYLSVRCQNSSLIATAHILEVDVIPNHPPVFQVNAASTTVKVPANDGDLVYRVTATDVDGDVLTYSIKATAPPVNYFTIDTTTGRISVSTANNLYTATESKVVVTVEVSDGYTFVYNFQLTVNITDINQRPDIVELPRVQHILENAPIGTRIISLNIIDNAAPVPQTLPSCTVLPANERFKFNFVPSGQSVSSVTLASALDYETTSSYTISCSVTDGYLNSENEVLTLYVDNVNEPPVFSDIAYYCILEESNAGISGCDLASHDILSDPEGDVISFVGFASGNNSNRFRYMRSANRVTFNVDYDVDQAMPTSVVLQLQATDIHGASSRVPVYITVTDANDNTCYFTPSSVQPFPVNQGTPIGILGRLVARDDDLTSPNNLVTYELVMAQPPDSINYLSFYSDGTVAYAAAIPDWNQPKTYSLTVRCRDGGTPRKTSEATVALTYIPTTSTITTPTTTTSTATTSTTTPSTTTATTTTTEAKDVWDDRAFVGTFAALMCLLAIGLLVGVWLCARYCLLGKSAASFGGSGLQDFCCPRPKPKKVEPVDDYFTNSVRTNPDYKDDYWRQGDKFETGKEESPTNPTAGGPVRQNKPAPPQDFQF